MAVQTTMGYHDGGVVIRSKRSTNNNNLFRCFSLRALLLQRNLAFNKTLSIDIHRTYYIPWYFLFFSSFFFFLATLNILVLILLGSYLSLILSYDTIRIGICVLYDYRRKRDTGNGGFKEAEPKGGNLKNTRRITGVRWRGSVWKVGDVGRCGRNSRHWSRSLIGATIPRWLDDKINSARNKGGSHEKSSPRSISLRTRILPTHANIFTYIHRLACARGTRDDQMTWQLWCICGTRATVPGVCLESIDAFKVGLCEETRLRPNSSMVDE